MPKNGITHVVKLEKIKLCKNTQNSFKNYFDLICCGLTGKLSDGGKRERERLILNTLTSLSTHKKSSK